MEILFATTNPHKTQEVHAILGEEFDVLDLTHFPGAGLVEETGETFEENAALKAYASSLLFDGLVLSDDSGLEVDALGGAPGVMSARYAGLDASASQNREALRAALRALPELPEPIVARFQCCMVLAQKTQVLGVFSGVVEGSLLLEDSGTGGFGYDPMFIPDGYAETFASLPSETKNAISHRASALRQVREFIQNMPR